MSSSFQQQFRATIERLQNEDASWIGFCRLTNRVARFIFQAKMDDIRTNAQHGCNGEYLVDRVLNQRSGDDCLQLCRMRPHAFRSLVSYLKEHYDCADSRYISSEQRLAIAMFIMGHSAGIRLAHILFGHSISTIHEHFHYVLEKLTRLSTDIIRPHPNYLNRAGYHSPSNPRHYMFKDCIGAMDGTHIPAMPPQDEAERYRKRKGTLTQNVLAIVDFNMCFIFAASSWEGSTHDSRMLNSAIENPRSRFPLPFGNKYYLVDSGFAHRRGFLGPYRGHNERYHVQEFHRASSSQARIPRTREERFNYMHSSCRNVVERSFCVLKKRFLILQRMPEYAFEAQKKIVLATMAVHNFLRNVDNLDPGFVAAMRPDYQPMEPNDPDSEEAVNVAHQPSQDRHEWDMFRERIADVICGG